MTTAADAFYRTPRRACLPDGRLWLAIVRGWSREHCDTICLRCDVAVMSSCDVHD